MGNVFSAPKPKGPSQAELDAQRRAEEQQRREKERLERRESARRRGRSGLDALLNTGLTGRGGGLLPVDAANSNLRQKLGA